jgi:hypothetical protein
VSQVFGTADLAWGGETLDRYRMISTVEYAGRGQFRNQVETLFTVVRESLPDDKVRYSFVTYDPNLDPGQKSSMTFSFIIDRNTRLMSEVGEDMAFWTAVHNESVKSLVKITEGYIGKTWKQTIDLSPLSDAPFAELRFTLTAIQLRTKAFGEMIAVRALSEPLFVKLTKGYLRCKISTVYLFGSDIEDVYLSISVFEGATDVNGVKETLRHEVATYGTDATGRPLDLRDVGEDFERLVGKIGLSKNSLEITKESPLPQWAQTKGIRAAQVASICSAVVCEGALNPVATISIPTTRILESQRESGSSAGVSLFERLVGGFGWNLPTVGIIGAAVAIPIALSGGGGGGGHAPASP